LGLKRHGKGRKSDDQPPPVLAQQGEQRAVASRNGEAMLEASPSPDLREEAFCQKLVADAVQRLGGLDIVICNAGRQQSKPSILDITTEDFDATMKTNIYAPFCIIKAALPHLKHALSARRPSKPTVRRRTFATTLRPKRRR
jgi:NAD(P)-dependent dehydrogenase (short-subunit alcohol dehydrogenase family)